MVFRKRTVKNTRKFKPSTKTSIKTSTINKRSVGNNRTVKVSQNKQYGPQQDKISYSGDKGFGIIPSASAQEQPTRPVSEPVNLPPTLTQFAKSSIDSSQPTYESEGTYSNVSGKKIYENKVYFKDIRGEGTGDYVATIKTKFKPTDQQLQILGAMEAQKDPQFAARSYAAATEGRSYVHGSQNKEIMPTATNAHAFHGNLFKHLSNESGDYIKLSEAKQDPATKNFMWEKRKSDYKPPSYGDRKISGIGRMSYTGFAGGKTEEGDPFKFTKPKDKVKVWNTRGTPQWMDSKKVNPELIENTLLKQRKGRNESVKVISSKHRTSGGRNLFGSFDSSFTGEKPSLNSVNTDASDYFFNRSEKLIKKKQNERKNKNGEFLDEVFGPDVNILTGSLEFNFKY